MTKKDDINKFPNIKKHLENYKQNITCPEVIEKKHPWYSLHRPRDPEIFLSPKFIGLTTTKSINISLDLDSNLYATDALYLFKIKKSVNFSYYYILGILNSKLFEFLYRVSVQGDMRVIPQIKATALYKIPFPNVDMLKEKEKKLHDGIVELVKLMFEFNKQFNKARSKNEKLIIQRQIDGTNDQINRLVYELYDLTKRELLLLKRV